MRLLEYSVLSLLIVLAVLTNARGQNSVTPKIHPPTKHKGSDTVGVVNGTLITYCGHSSPFLQMALP